MDKWFDLKEILNDKDSKYTILFSERKYGMETALRRYYGKKNTKVLFIRRNTKEIA